mmetsp:Transcript_3764/g.9542  ORF Transcript_3764/g.9542 Transcript_3764/m.9542 type:complete len:222 (+) Transcript_3764:1719-2384(+)
MLFLVVTVRAARCKLGQLAALPAGQSIQLRIAGEKQVQLSRIVPLRLLLGIPLALSLPLLWALVRVFRSVAKCVHVPFHFAGAGGEERVIEAGIVPVGTPGLGIAIVLVAAAARLPRPLVLSPSRSLLLEALLPERGLGVLTALDAGVLGLQLGFQGIQIAVKGHHHVSALRVRRRGPVPLLMHAGPRAARLGAKQTEKTALATHLPTNRVIGIGIGISIG